MKFKGIMCKGVDLIEPVLCCVFLQTIYPVDVSRTFWPYVDCSEFLELRSEVISVLRMHCKTESHFVATMAPFHMSAICQKHLHRILLHIELYKTCLHIRNTNRGEIM
jgi:hypothetical protein